MKKILSILLLFSMLFTLVSGITSCNSNEDLEDDSETESESATETEEESQSQTVESESQEESETVKDEDVLDNSKTIDIYLIAGQSNAAGCTKITDVGAAYATISPSGYPYVHYAGNSRSNGSEPRDRDLPWQKARMGLGITGNMYFGPEAGMAKVFDLYYNEETGRSAGIIKYAFGGSSLLNDTTGSTASDGNWVPPSYQATLPQSQVVGATGQMYRNFLEQVERNISELEDYGGYTSVRICGLYWMQGCANKGKPAEYEKAIKYFAADVRRDLSAIMKEYTGTDNDCGASEMPIIIGTISQTQNLVSATTEQTNITFIQMQKSLANKIPNCYVVDNSAFKITEWRNGTQIKLGSDQWHWNQADALTIGQNVGNAMLYCAGIISTDPFPAS